MTDYSSYFGGSTSGGSSSGGAYGGYFTSPPKKKKESSGGFWDDIGGAISHQLGRIPGEHYVASGLGGAAGVTGAGLGQLGSIIHGIPTALIRAPGMAWHDINRPHVSLIDLIGNPSQGLRGLGAELHDPKGLVGSTYLPIESDVGHAKRGDWHYFATHPLNPILDAATVASLGGGGALKLASAGRLGERAAALANEPRLLKVGEHAEELTPARTLQGRIRQQAFDRYSMANPDMPIIGANHRMKLILNTRAASQMLRARVPVRHFQRITGQLTNEEKFAYHVAAEGVPLNERIAFYKAEIANRPTRALRQYLKHLESPRVAEALHEPRPQFIEALTQGKVLEETAGQRLVATGQVAPESRTERAALPQGVMGYKPPGRQSKLPEGLSIREEPVSDVNTWRKWRAYIPGREKHVGEFMVHSYKGKRGFGSAPERHPEGEIHMAEVDPEFRRQGVATEMFNRAKADVPELHHAPKLSEDAQAWVPTLARGTNPIHPDLPAPFRFWHSGGKGSTAGAFIAPKTEGMLGKAATLGQTKHSLGIRLRQATFETDPERVLSQDYLSTMRHEAIIQMQKEALDPISQPLSADLADYGFKREGEFYYRPSYDRKTTAPVAPHVRNQENLTRDRSAMDAEARRASVKKGAEGIVSQDIGDLLKPGEIIDPADLHNMEKLDALGIRRVPAAFGKDFSKEFGGTPWAVRIFFDRPLDVWRAITLNLRPAWAVNNLFGNALMGLASHPGSAAAYLRTLRLERGDDKVMQLWRWTAKRPTLRRKYGRAFEDAGISDLHSAGLFGTQAKVTREGVHEGRFAGFRANRAVRVLGFTPKMVGKTVMAVGRGITKMEVVLAEDTGREAVFMNAMGADIAKIRATAKKMGEGNIAYSEAVKRLDRPAVEHGIRAVHDALGDFNALSPFERSYVRRVIPFYSWFKVITKVSAKYAVRYPERLKMLQAIEQAQNTDGEPALPSWLTGSIPLGKSENGVQRLISTQGINPYETIPQLAEGGPIGITNPLIAAAFPGATGRNAAFGTLQDYYGLGATSRTGWPGFLERYSGGLVGSLAPVRILQGETQKYQGKLYDPTTYRRNLLLQYLGLPVRDVKVQEAKRERGL